MRVDHIDELAGWALSMLQVAPVGHLGLLDGEDRPRVLPVTFALHDGAFYSAVDEKPKRVPPSRLARVRYLRRSPDASLTVDHYDADWSKLAWVQALCRAEILESLDPSALDALAAKYRPYREAPPGGPLIRLVPHRLICWRAAP